MAPEGRPRDPVLNDDTTTIIIHGQHSPCEFDISGNNLGFSDSDLTNSASHRGERSGVGGKLLVPFGAEGLLGSCSITPRAR